MNSKQTILKDLLEQVNNTLINKDKDYGSSFSDTRKEFGRVAIMIRLTDKYNRLKQLIKNPDERKVKDETIEDTLMDLVGYCLLELIEIQLDKQEQTEQVIPAPKPVSVITCEQCTELRTLKADITGANIYRCNVTGLDLYDIITSITCIGFKERTSEQIKEYNGGRDPLDPHN